MRIAVLGPKGTYSEKASCKYFENTNIDYELVFFNTIDEAVYALNEQCDMTIVPIENTLDGYVQKTLDLLLEDNINIVDQISVAVSFKLISNVEINKVNKIFAQFKAIGQCSNFINKLNNVTIVNTESNIISYDYWRLEQNNSAAIVPSHLNVAADYIIDDITDSSNNFTRFFVLSKESKFSNKDGLLRIPLYIIPHTEHPGLLYQILKVFNDYNINLTSILSRPKKVVMGEYNFYIEIEATKDQLNNFLSHVDNSNKNFTIKILGILEEKLYGKIC